MRRAALEALGDRPPDRPILPASVPDLRAKEVLLAEDADVCFTTPHFDGYPAILVERIAARELEELVVEAWLDRAPKRLAGTTWTPGRRAALVLRRLLGLDFDLT